MAGRQPIALAPRGRIMRLPCADSSLRLVGRRIGWPAMHPALNLAFLLPAGPASTDPARPAHWLHLLYHLIRSIELRFDRSELQQRRESYSALRWPRPSSLAPDYPLRRRERMQLPLRRLRGPAAAGQMGAAGAPRGVEQSNLPYLFRSADAVGAAGARGQTEAVAQRLILLALRAQSGPSGQSQDSGRRHPIERSSRALLSTNGAGATVASGQSQQPMPGRVLQFDVQQSIGQAMRQRLIERGNRRRFSSFAASAAAVVGPSRSQMPGRMPQFALQKKSKRQAAQASTAIAVPESRAPQAPRFASRQSGPLAIGASAARWYRLFSWSKLESQQLTQMQLRQFRYLTGSDGGQKREPDEAVFPALQRLVQLQRDTGRQPAASPLQQARASGRRRQRQNIRPTATPSAMPAIGLSVPSPHRLGTGSRRHRPSMQYRFSLPGTLEAAPPAMTPPMVATTAAVDRLPQLSPYRPGIVSALAYRETNQVRQADVQRQLERVERTVHTKVVREVMHHSQIQQQVRGAVADALLSPQLLQSLARQIHATIEQRAAIDRYRKGER